MSLSSRNNSYTWRNLICIRIICTWNNRNNKKEVSYKLFSSIGLWSTKYIYFIGTYILLLLLNSVLRKYSETHETDKELFTAHITSFELTVILEINATTWELYSCFHLFSTLEVTDAVARYEFIHLIIHPLWDLETEFTIEKTVKRKRQESKYVEYFP